MDFDIDLYGIIFYSQCSLECVTPMLEKNRPRFFAFPWKFFIEAAFAFEPYGWALLQAVLLNINTKVWYQETSLRLRRDVLKFWQLFVEHTC